jgi:murein L,D-transpeptidase YcbB/YkuD
MRNALTVAAAALATALPVSAAASRSVPPDHRSPDAAWAPARRDTILGVDAAIVAAAIRDCLVRPHPAHLPVEHWRHAQRLYGAYDNAPLWFNAEGLNERRVTALVSALIDATTDALRLEEYSADEIARSVPTVRRAKRLTAEEIAAIDVRLTAAYIALASDLLSGQYDPRRLNQAWHVHLEQERLDSAVARSLRDEHLDSALARMRPRDEGYVALQGKLLELRTIVARGGWAAVPSGRAVRAGDGESAARLRAVRQRLAAEGLPSGGGADSAELALQARRGVESPRASEVYDVTLANAVARFQARHGIVVDGVLGKETVAAMNIPAAYRLGQIAANLERFRWLPRSLGDRYVLVNIPAFRLEAYDATRKALEMKVIVGAEYEGRRTPVFADSMEYVVFRPYWLVPTSIQARELEPQIAKDPGFMARGNYEHYFQNGRRFIRQRPGRMNALGLVKFIFPNSFNIYLHDTPEDELFAQDVRAFSHGCIRLEKPGRLAEWVLGWTEDQVRDAEQGKDDHRVTLPTKIPVYIVYFTTYVRDGELYFGNDLYSRDGELVRTVAAGAFPSAEALRTIEALRGLLE